MRRILSELIIFLSLALPASAQRTVAGEGALTAVPVFTGSSYGLHAGWTGWTLWGAWSAGAVGRQYLMKATDEYNLEYVHAALESDALYRLFSTRSRMLSVYAGGGAFVGVELSDPFGKLPSWVSAGDGKPRFIYGLQGLLEVDIYILRRVSLGVRAAAPVNFSSRMGWFHWESGITLRIGL